MNNWYNRIVQSSPQQMNMMQRAQSFMNALRDPVSFVKQNIPGIPDQAFNDPTGNGVLQYMIQNLGVTQQDIQNASSKIPRF